MSKIQRLKHLATRAAAFLRDPSNASDLVRYRLSARARTLAPTNQKLAQLRASVADKSVDELVQSSLDTLNDQAPDLDICRFAVTEALRLYREDLISPSLLTAFGSRCRGLVRLGDVPGVYSVSLRFSGGYFEIGLAKDFLGWPFLVDRLFALSEYLDRYSAQSASGQVLLCVGDLFEGDEPQLCFSGSMPHHFLIPDPIFLATNGYDGFRNEVLSKWKPWELRRDSAYWRGSLTGLAHTYKEIMQLPRVELSLLSQHVPNIDASITDLSQYGPLLPTLQFILEGLGTIKPHESAIRNLEYKYLIDVDGNSNSWPGLYQKLLCGSVVIKAVSEFKQWYYDRLIPHDHFVPAKSISDIPASIAECASSPSKAQLLAKRARKFALSMRPDSEYIYFNKSADSAMRKHA